MRSLVLSISIGILFSTAIAAYAMDTPTNTPGDTPTVESENLRPLTRWAVFPFDASEERLKTTAEKAWWQSREKITEKKRFLVASKQFLIQREVFEPRRELSVDNVKYLAQHLEADVLVTGYSEYRDFKINVYLGQTGQLIWSKKMGFHPSLRATDQLLNVAERLTADLLNAIPYQGHTIEVSDRPQNTMAIDVGINENLKIGDEINLTQITVPQTNEKEISFDKLDTHLIAQGKVISIKKNHALIQIPPKGPTLKGEYFVNVLKERLEASYQDRLALEMMPDGIPGNEDIDSVHTHSRKTIVFGSVLSFLGILLLAF